MADAGAAGADPRYSALLALLQDASSRAASAASDAASAAAAQLALHRAGAEARGLLAQLHAAQREALDAGAARIAA